MKLRINEVIQTGKIYLLLYNRETRKQFFKYFDTEYSKDKFRKKLRYSKRIVVIEDSTDLYFGERG